MTTENAGKAKLFSKIAKVMATVRTLPKDGENKFDRYNYITGDSVFERVGKAMSDANLAALPSIIELTTQTGESAGGKPMLRTVIHGQITLADGETGETWTSDWYGEGADRGDKSINKAMTAMMKYYLLRLFMVGSGEDADEESPEANIAPQKTTQRQPPASQASSNGHRNTTPPPVVIAEPPAEDTKHPFTDPDAGAQAERRHKMEAMTEKAAQWRKMDDAADPCSTKQYGYFVSVVESITGKGTHPQAFNVMFKRPIDADNRPGKRAVQWLFDILPEQVAEKDAAGKFVTNDAGKNVYVANTKRDQVAVDAVKALYASTVKQEQPNRMAV